MNILNKTEPAVSNIVGSLYFRRVLFPDIFRFSKKVSEYDQELPQSQTADNPVAP